MASVSRKRRARALRAFIERLTCVCFPCSVWRVYGDYEFAKFLAANDVISNKRVDETKRHSVWRVYGDYDRGEHCARTTISK